MVLTAQLPARFAKPIPLALQRALSDAAIDGDIEAIDKITDKLAELGHCRPRDDQSLYPITRMQRAMLGATAGWKS